MSSSPRMICALEAAKVAWCSQIRREICAPPTALVKGSLTPQNDNRGTFFPAGPANERLERRNDRAESEAADETRAEAPAETERRPRDRPCRAPSAFGEDRRSEAAQRPEPERANRRVSHMLPWPKRREGRSPAQAKALPKPKAAARWPLDPLGIAAARRRGGLRRGQPVRRPTTISARPRWWPRRRRKTRILSKPSRR